MITLEIFYLLRCGVLCSGAEFYAGGGTPLAAPVRSFIVRTARGHWPCGGLKKRKLTIAPPPAADTGSTVGAAVEIGGIPGGGEDPDPGAAPDGVAGPRSDLQKIFLHFGYGVPWNGGRSLGKHGIP